MPSRGFSHGCARAGQDQALVKSEVQLTLRRLNMSGRDSRFFIGVSNPLFTRIILLLSHCDIRAYRCQTVICLFLLHATLRDIEFVGLLVKCRLLNDGLNITGVSL